MGQGQSYEEQSYGTQCKDMPDSKVVYYTKQYFTISKVIDILLDIENGTKTDASPSTNYMIDLGSVIPDIIAGQPNEISTELFKPESETIGIAENKPVEVLFTPLHRYNNFILREMPVLPSDTKKSRAKELRQELIPISTGLLKHITSYCSFVGLSTN